MDEEPEGQLTWQVWVVVCLVALCGWMCLAGGCSVIVRIASH